jgi:HSP20 family molecular chaperone IbpA
MLAFNTRRDPFWNVTFDDIDSVFARSAPTKRVSSPYQVEESDAGYLVIMDLPGVRKEDLKIETLDRTLTVSGERKLFSKDDAQKFTWRFSVPADAQAERVEAQLEDGVLRIALPKVEAAKPKTVEVRSSGSDLFAKFLQHGDKTDTAHRVNVG